MFNPESMGVLVSERRKELLRQAEMQRLACQAAAAQERVAPLHHETLAALGRQLITWGEHLQGRYSHVETAPIRLAAESLGEE